MKNHNLPLILSLLFTLVAISAFSQKTLTGVWSGRLTNDSLNTRKDQSYELALTEYRGKVYGYSYTTFIYNDTLYYIVKRVKGKIIDGICEVIDDEIVSHNFFNKLDKKVKVTQTFHINEQDSTWRIDGNWKTNQTKEFYSLTGTMALQQEKDHDKSKLLQHLGDLKLDKDVAFYQPEKKVYLSAPRKTAVKKETPVIAKADPLKKKPDMNSGVGALEIKNPEPPVQKPTEPDVTISKPDQSAVAVNKPVLETQKPDGSISGTKVNVSIENPVFEERTKKIIQTFTYKSDSLVLALYDNGEVDGDTVSVIVNGETFMAKQGLKSIAIKKTIYVPNGEDLEIVLFADNLGRFPPNTGLLIIRDGDERYEIRFSADFEQSAAIILKRKR